MSCKHGNHDRACDLCDAEEAAYLRGYKDGISEASQPSASSGRELPIGWRNVIANARAGINAGSRSRSDMDMWDRYGWPLLDHIEEELQALEDAALTSAAPADANASLHWPRPSQDDSTWTICPKFLNEIEDRANDEWMPSLEGIQAVLLALRPTAPEVSADVGRDAEPIAFLHDDPQRFEVIHAKVKELWLKFKPDHVEHYTIPLYGSAK